MSEGTASIITQVQNRRTFILALSVISPLILFLFILYLPPAADWYNTFALVTKSPLKPYNIRTFINPPWLALFLVPFNFLPVTVSQGVNAYLNLLFLTLLVNHYDGRRNSYLLALTSYPFLALIANGSTEWLAMAGFLMQGGLGTFFTLSKPQSGILAAIIWFKEAPNKKQFILILLIGLIVSFIIWGFWPVDLFQNTEYVRANHNMQVWNSSPWPWAIPLGIYFIYQGWKKSDSLMTLAATYCLLPYFAIHSLTIGFAILASRYRRLSVLAWILLWLYAIIRFTIHLHK